MSDSLSKEEIEDELINNDLISSGGIDDQEQLEQMGLEEKQNLLKGIKQSKEEFINEATSKSSNQPIFDTTNSNFPSLPPAGKKNNGTQNKLVLPRKVNLATDKEKSPDNSLFDKESKPQKFTLPFFADDGAPPLPPLERELQRVDNPYYVMDGETPAVAMKRMLAHHDKWKEQYLAEMSRLESRAVGEDIEEGKEQKASPRSDVFQEKENDPYDFSPDSPVRIPPKMYTGPRKTYTNHSSDTSLQPSSRTLQRKASRDSDCEEVEPILKPDKPKLNELITTPSRLKNKRNRKQMLNNEKNQPESSISVDFDFNNRWDQKSQWRGPQSSSSSSITSNRRSVPSAPVIEEEKVQCPICQHDFAKSKVENHAATCEGYSGSGSPMDVEEEN